jgi:hypothetical protein
MSLSFEVNGREKNFSFNLIAFWILLIGGAVLVVWHPAGTIVSTYMSRKSVGSRARLRSNQLTLESEPVRF